MPLNMLTHLKDTRPGSAGRCAANLGGKFWAPATPDFRTFKASTIEAHSTV